MRTATKNRNVAGGWRQPRVGGAPAAVDSGPPVVGAVIEALSGLGPDDEAVAVAVLATVGTEAITTAVARIAGRPGFHAAIVAVALNRADVPALRRAIGQDGVFKILDRYNDYLMSRLSCFKYPQVTTIMTTY